MRLLGFGSTRQRGPAPGYRPASDDHYEFADPSVQRSRVRTGAQAWTVEATSAKAASALIQVRVQAARSSAWFELRNAGGAVVRHHLDPATNGLRWFDVSGLLAHDGGEDTEWTLRSQGVQFGSEPELLVFEDPLRDTRRAIVFAPHPDDAEIAAFGLYKRCDSAVITVTGGDAGGENYRRFYTQAQPQFDLKRRLRVWDSLAVPLWAGLGPDRVANLGYFDETLDAMHKDRSERMRGLMSGETELDRQRRSFDPAWLREGAEPTWASLVADIAHTISKFHPTTVVAPHPALDAHRDHRATTFALFEALESLPEAHGVQEMLLYVNHPVYCSDWPFGPPCADSALPPSPRFTAQASGFFSQPLTLDDQVDKLFALEAMHDLRRAPPSITTSRDWGVFAAVWAARDAFLRHKVGESSYFRRAVRARELFFVYRTADIPQLRREWLDAPSKW